MRLDNTKLVSILGNEPHTPAEEAVRASLTGLARAPDTQLNPYPAAVK
jgi:hypothetical protein